MSVACLKTVVRDKILEDVIEGNGKENLGKTQWRVLVVDEFTRKIISESIQMHELTPRGIILIESLEGKRSPMPNYEAIYFITPTEASVEHLIQDFKSNREAKYRAARVLFAQTCPEKLFKVISQSYVVPHLKALKEVDMAYLPYERQVFSLELPEVLKMYYNQGQVGVRDSEMEDMAEKLATVCTTLDEIPSVRYRAGSQMNETLAKLVQQKLDKLKSDHPKLGEGAEKAKSQLIILDRGFDITSMLLHELTYQAMVYDLLPVENNVYKILSEIEVSKELRFDEKDTLWKEIQHQHIADVVQKVPSKFKAFMDKNGMDSQDPTSVRGLQAAIKKMPQNQKEISQFSNHIRVAEDCMAVFNKYVSNLCEVEQDLAMGTNANGATIRNLNPQTISSILLEQSINTKDKIRIILLYVLAKQGVTEDILNKLISHAQIPPEEGEIIYKMANLGVPLNSSEKPRPIYKSKENTYAMSRWTPLVKDILKNATEDRLDSRKFPFVKEKKSSPNTASNYLGWLNNTTQGSPASMRKSNVKKSQIICFIAGGVGYSEMRAAYEVSKEKDKWQVIIGGSEIITPEQFLENVKALDS